MIPFQAVFVKIVKKSARGGFFRRAQPPPCLSQIFLSPHHSPVPCGSGSPPVPSLRLSVPCASALPVPCGSGSPPVPFLRLSVLCVRTLPRVLDFVNLLKNFLPPPADGLIAPPRSLYPSLIMPACLLGRMHRHSAAEIVCCPNHCRCFVTAQRPESACGRRKNNPDGNPTARALQMTNFGL